MICFGFLLCFIVGILYELKSDFRNTNTRKEKCKKTSELPKTHKVNIISFPLLGDVNIHEQLGDS